MARILITTFGSLGDLFPYLAIAGQLTRRGHSVTIATSGVHRAAVESEGLQFHPVRPDIDRGNPELIAYVMDARRGSERIVRYLASLVRETYQDTLEAARHTDAIVTHPITFASVLIAQQLQLPWISTVLAPISFLSAYDPPVTAQAPWLHGLRILGPRFMKWFWDNGRRHTLQWLKPVLEFRRELRLPPGSHPLFDGSHSPSLVLALFSRELARPQPDWPANTVVTGFPFYEHGEAPPGLERFLAAGPPPVIFTLGSSAVTAAGSFYVESLEAVRRLGCRAVFLTGPHPQGLPDILPPNVIAIPYAPHNIVFPRGSAIVHQGGVGTTAQAMRSGLPQLVMPFAHDQFDNAARVRNIGAAQVISRARYRSGRVAAVLTTLLNNPSYKTAAFDLGRQIRNEDGAATAAASVERFISSAA